MVVVGGKRTPGAVQCPHRLSDQETTPCIIHHMYSPSLNLTPISHARTYIVYALPDYERRVKRGKRKTKKERNKNNPSVKIFFGEVRGQEDGGRGSVKECGMQYLCHQPDGEIIQA